MDTQKMNNSRNDPRILVVDDDEDICRLFQGILVIKGYLVDTALTGHEALEKADKIVYDVAVLDINLPDMDGILLLKKIKKLNPGSYCIMATGYASLQNSVRALNEGAFAYLIKPLDIADVQLSVQKALQEKKLKERLESSERKHREFVEHSLDGIVRFNFHNGRVISVNPAYCRLLGYMPEQLLGKSIAEYFVDPEDRRMMLKLLETDGAFKDFEYPLKTKNASIKTVSSTSRAIYDSNDAIIEVEEIIRDITEKMMLENNLRESEGIYRTIFENAPYAFLFFDIHGNLKAINSKGFELFQDFERREYGYISRRLGVHHQKLPSIEELMKGTCVEISNISISGAGIDDDVFFDICIVPIVESNGGIKNILFTAKKTSTTAVSDTEM